ncbi:MAG TPA: bacillithiol biosynthesis cysteine-adding enzyme BshC [Pyrinomonadaceae bacterium]|nr:bacillithiol biosynthesis cysteine-adding enzyme BshC [Pyrinomonadaceae bacterium]
MNETSVGIKPSESTRLRLSNIPFAKIPGQSRLFLDHLAGSTSISKYYPNYRSNVAELVTTEGDVLSQYSTDRNAICDALVEINTEAGSSEASMANIERLRRPDTVAVLTGQQAGLFTGPLYTIYKAMTAIKIAQRLAELGVEAVPIFWAATEDHDFDEVSWASVIGHGDGVVKAHYRSETSIEGLPVGKVVINSSIGSTIEDLFATLSTSSELRRSIDDCWTDGSSFGTAFLKQIAELFAPYGLVLVDPMNTELRRLSSPIISSAIANAGTINERLRERDAELVADGYHSQVLVDEDYFPAFIFNEKGQRSALKLTATGSFRSKVDGREFGADELKAIAADDPKRFSPGVMLRPVVQDHLFPTICYVGGGAEIAYFGQSSVVYETLGRRVTPIFHRQSFTIVEPRIRRALEAYDLDIESLFVGREALVPQIVERIESPETAELLDEVTKSINSELAKLDAAFDEIDVTLAAGFAKRRKKIEYHLSTAKEKAYAAIMRKSGDANRRLDAILSNLMPYGGLQEREINVLSYLSKYGDSFLKTIAESTDPDERGHVVIDI